MPKISKKRMIIGAALTFFGVVAVMVLVVFQVFKLKVVDGAKYEKSANKTTEISIPAVRGSILAVDGRTMACSLPYYEIGMDPNVPGLPDSVFNKNINALAAELAAFFKDKSASEYREMIVKVRGTKRSFVRLNKRLVTFNELQRIKQFPILNRGKFKGGLIVKESDTRARPFGILAQRTIGSIREDEKKGDKVKIGSNGIELSYNKELSGENGLAFGNKDYKNIVREPIDGLDVRTTINIDFQDVAESSLLRQLYKYNADHGVAILMEVRTGAVRAIVNLRRDETGNYREILNDALVDDAEPGSTFKLATLMTCLDDGVFTVNDTINTFGGQYKFYDLTMRDSHSGTGVLTVKEAFEVSSNIAFSRLVDKHYRKDPQRFIEGLRDLGLCDSLGIDIRGAVQSTIKDNSDKTWSQTSLPWMSIGYEVKITPLQLLTFYNAVANKGQMMRPMFVEALEDHGREVRTFSPKVLRSSIASRSTISAAHKLLKGVVENGTAKSISNTPYKIAGKTGTAQIAKDGRYTIDGRKMYQASFAGYFPADDPLYSCIVVISDPKGSYYASTVACPVVKAIADRVYAAEYRKGHVREQPKIVESEVLPYSKGGRSRDVNIVLAALKMPRDQVAKGWVSATAQSDKVQLTTRHFVDNVMPDVRGMGASDAVSLLESMGLRVKLSGFGRVKEQNPSNGTQFTRGEIAQIILGN